ncbi:MAG TPA: type II secretion system F family protein, partial [Chloroflexota bacterium]|nr:type II secretion system F family protein [Chloroflexota bacterium]
MNSSFLLATAGFFALALPTLAGVLTLTRRSNGTVKRLAAVERLQQELVTVSAGFGPRPSDPASLLASGVAQQRGGITGRLGQLPPGRRLLARAERDLEYAPWALTPSAYLARRFCAALLLGTAVWFVLRTPLAFIIGVVVANVLAGSLVAHQVWLYRRNVGRQTEDVIDILIAHLRAGQSLVQSLGALTEEAPVPARREYARVIRQIALGTPVSEALRSMARRIPVTPVSLLISALNLHHR